jgi:2-methylcitrate dehydratase PrpD
MENLTPSQTFAQFAKNLRIEDVPEDVIAMTKRILTDAIGLCYTSTDLEYTQSLLRVVDQMGGREESTVIGTGKKYPAAMAALVNGVQIHGHDYDDTHSGSVTHTSPSIIPVVLALGERNESTGKELLEAAIVGLEIACRVGLSAHGMFQRKGFHTTAIAGAMGGVLAACKLLNLDVEKMVHAQGIAGSSAAGLREAYLSGGSWTKMYHPGWSAHSAIMAALVAGEGFTGTSTVYEGRFGLFKSHLQPYEADFEALLDDLGERWEIRNICFKPYPCGVINHAYIDSAFKLMEENQFEAEDIQKVICYIHPDAAQTVCEPVDSKLRPESGYHAKFSLQYSVSAALVEGNVSIHTFSDEKVKDPNILAMTDKVEYLVDSSSTYPSTYPSWLVIELKDGRVLVDKQEFNKGSIENPMTDAEINRKYFDNAMMRISKEQAVEIQEKIARIQDLKSILELSGNL